MACGGVYRGADPTIVAVGPSLYGVPCGTPITICGPGGCIAGRRTDSCPGCDLYGVIDLSEAGLLTVCGAPGNCRVSVWIGGR